MMIADIFDFFRFTERIIQMHSSAARNHENMLYSVFLKSFYYIISYFN